jgi:hypothetical protein
MCALQRHTSNVHVWLVDVFNLGTASTVPAQQRMRDHVLGGVDVLIQLLSSISTVVLRRLWKPFLLGGGFRFTPHSFDKAGMATQLQSDYSIPQYTSLTLHSIASSSSFVPIS